MSDTEEPMADYGEKWHPLAALVASGRTVKDGAEELGIAERTAYRWAGESEFKSRVSELRSVMASEAVGKLTSAASEAVDTLRELMNEGHEAKTRLDAAKMILANLGPVTEAAELRTRVDELESGR